MAHEYSTRRNTAPPLSHPMRGFFEGAVQRGNTGGEYLARLDNFIEQARKNTSVDEAYQQAVNYQSALYGTIQEARECPRTDVLSYYRLLTMAALLPQLVVAPRVFSDPQSTYDERFALTADMVGISGEIMEELVSYFAEASIKNEQDQLRGAINEQTALAAVNYSDTGEVVALPSLTYADYRQGIDMEIYTYGSPQPAPRQIKSSSYKDYSSNKIPTVSLGQHNEGFVISRAICNLMNTGHIRPEDEQRILGLRTALIDAKSQTTEASVYF